MQYCKTAQLISGTTETSSYPKLFETPIMLPNMHGGYLDNVSISLNQIEPEKNIKYDKDYPCSWHAKMERRPYYTSHTPQYVDRSMNYSTSELRYLKL